MQNEYFQKIRKKSETGLNIVSSGRSLKSVKDLHDFVLVPAQVSRLVYDGYREVINTKTSLSKKDIEKNIELDIPIIINNMSIGALSKEVKIAISMAGQKSGIAITTGGLGGVLKEERQSCSRIIFQMISGRHVVNRELLTNVDAIEIMLGQGSKPGMGAHLQAEKVTDEIAEIMMTSKNKNLRNPSRQLDILGPDDLKLKIEELRELTDYKIPITVKIAAGRVNDDIKLIAKAGADAIVIDAFSAGTGAAPEIIQNNVGLPLIAALKLAREGLKEINMQDKVSLIVSGGIFDGADIVKAIALGADMVALGTGILAAAGCNNCYRCYTGECEAGICTQNIELRKRIDIESTANSIHNYLSALKKEIKLILAALGKTDIRSLELEDIRALDYEAKIISGAGLVGEY